MLLSSHTVSKKQVDIIREIATLALQTEALQMDLWVSENQQQHLIDEYRHLHVYVAESKDRKPLLFVVDTSRAYPILKVMKSLSGFYHPIISADMDASRVNDFVNIFSNENDSNSATSTRGDTFFRHKGTRIYKVEINVWIKNGGEITFYLEEDDLQEISDLLNK